jgi:hypothetical protein
MRVGVIRNAKSYRNRKPDEAFRSTATQWLGEDFAEPASLDEMKSVLADFARREIKLLVIDGGDGTLHKTLGALPPAWESAPPLLAILPSGNTNLIAADVGCGLRGLPGLKRLLDAARTGAWKGHVERRSALEVEWGDGAHAPQRGMFLGAAAFTRGIDIAHDGVHAQGLFQKSAVMLTLALSAAQSLRATSRERWLAGDLMSVGIDTDDTREGARFLFLATGLQKLFFGIWPFWDEQGAKLRYLDVDAHPKKLIRAGAALLRGHAPQWMRDSEQYRSGGATRIALQLSHRFVLDGEVFEPGPSGQIFLKAGPSMEFVVL